MRPQQQKTLIIMAKSPRMGLAKTRLAVDIGRVQAWRIKRALDAFTCRVAPSQSWQTYLAVSPARDRDAHFGGIWPAHIRRIAQGKGDLGARMARVLHQFRAGPVCIIGSYLPALRRADLGAAFKALRRHDVVLGPATDGGFWLIGMTGRCAARATLSPVRWSSASTLSDTLTTFPKHWRIAFLRELSDIDDDASLTAARSHNTP
jgi:rSAM/selenodomain-associated transferase 1